MRKKLRELLNWVNAWYIIRVILVVGGTALALELLSRLQKKEEK